MFSDTPLEQIHEEIKVLFSSLQFGVSLIVIKPVLFFLKVIVSCLLPQEESRFYYQAYL